MRPMIARLLAATATALLLLAIAGSSVAYADPPPVPPGSSTNGVPSDPGYGDP